MLSRLGLTLLGTVATGLLMAVGVVALASSRSAGSAATKPRTACTDPGSGERSFRIKPRSCDFVKRGESANAFTIDTESMRWSRWGKQARGRGKTFVSMDGYRRVKVILRRPVNRCGRRVYARGVFRIPAYNAKIIYPLYTC
jgi:hypothetical protein